MVAVEERQQKGSNTSVQPFGVEADHPRNCDLLIQSIPGCRLRGAVNASKPVIDKATGEAIIPVDQSRHLGALPSLPGMQLHVSPATLQYTIIDPLHENQELCDRIQRRLNETAAFKVEAVRGIPPQKGTLDIHRMKTLCRELYHIVKASEGKVVKGVLPEMKEIDSLPGKYLLNPGSQIPNTQPTYEEDWEEWVERLTRAGG